MSLTSQEDSTEMSLSLIKRQIYDESRSELALNVDVICANMKLSYLVDAKYFCEVVNGNSRCVVYY